MKRASRKALRFCGTLLLSATASSVAALDASFHYKIGYDVGGDTVARVTFTNGDTESIKANEGFFAGAGVSLVNEAQDVQTEISLSYKFGGSIADNGDVLFTSLPVDVLVFYRWPRIRLGGGFVHHLAPELEVSGAGGSFASNTKYQDSTGTVVQLDYRVTEKINLGLRYTKIDYEQEGTGASFDGNSVGIVFSGNL